MFTAVMRLHKKTLCRLAPMLPYSLNWWQARLYVILPLRTNWITAAKSTDMFAYGIKRFVTGLAKKVLLANTIGQVWTQLSAMEVSSMSVVGTWVGALAFTFQIYFDFSAYSDMAIGLGQMLGFKFLENFDYPYISKSITEFWRRWHISLGTWFREYVYIPLGGNRKGLIRQIFNLLIVWFCTGFWHGASWNFLIWGGYYGVLLIIEKLFLLKVLKKIPAFFLSCLYPVFCCNRLGHFWL